MIDLGPHAVFIASAYLGVAAALLAVVVHTAVARRRVETRIRALEGEGVRRRAERQGS